MLQIKGLTFAYPNGPELITDLTMEVFKGDRIAIIGPNGRGKTTLLNLIANELKPVAGEIAPNPNVQINYFGQHPTPMFMPGQTTEFTEADLKYPGVLYTMQPEDAARMEEILDTAGETLLDRRNFSVWSILREEVTAFLGGVGSAEECASKIQSRVSIYLAETH
jgi:ATPase subunit of ABC transporter with duplicated ATPase domains